MKKMMIVPALIGAVVMGSTFSSVNSAEAASKLSIEQIEKKALKIVKGTITDIEYENKGSRSYYEVEIVKGMYEYDLKFNPTTGALISKKREYRD